MEVFQGNRPLVEGLVVLFMEQTPRLVKELVEVVRAGDLQSFHGVSFRLKSNLRVLGFPEIRDQVGELGTAMRHGTPSEELESDLESLVIAVDQACRHLNGDFTA